MVDGFTQFQHADIDVISTPVYERNFVRIMAMMAVPPEGKIFDVSPKNGIKPIMYNKHDSVDSCLGYLDIANSFIDDEKSLIVIAISNLNTLSAIVDEDTIGIYLGGLPIYGIYRRETLSGVVMGVISIPIDTETYGAYRSLLSLPAQSLSIPVWIPRPYAPPVVGELTTTMPGTTSSPPDVSMVMDYYLDWSGGMNLSTIQPAELYPFPESETVSREYLVTSESCQWKKLCNTTGLSVTMDTSNHKANLTMSTGIITAGKPSDKEPQYWLIDLGDDVYLRVYLNIHEINYKMLGRYHLNVGQAHEYMSFRDSSIYGDLTVVEEDVTFTITTPAGSEIWADFWTDLLDFWTAHDVDFEANIRLLDRVDSPWYPCVLKHAGGVWSTIFTVPVEIGLESVPDIWADIEVTGYYTSKSVSTTISEAGTEAHIAFTPGDDDSLLNIMDVYTITHDDATYSMWWDATELQWAIDKIDEEIVAEAINILIHAISYDTVDFETEPHADGIFHADNSIFPLAPYYFRLKCGWQDSICLTRGGESWIREANIYIGSGDASLPTRYGIYAMSHYSVDEYGNQTRIMEHDINANSRYCGIYGRNHLCAPADTYLYGLSLYPDGTEFCLYYPPYCDRALITRAKSGLPNYIEYAVSSNAITFNLGNQLLGDARPIGAYATGELTVGDSTLSFQSNTPGVSGNGFRIDIILTLLAEAMVITGPVDGVLKILALTGSTVGDIYGALTDRRGVDYGVTVELDGDGLDVIADDTSIILGTGGDEMIVSNIPSARTVGEVYLHPGYMLNTSRRQSPINLVGIYAIYLSANYKYANGYIDVAAVDTGSGIDLYAVMYFGEARERYTLKSTISPLDETYTDEDLIPTEASYSMPLQDSSYYEIVSAEEGWIGNGTTLIFEWVTNDAWLGLEWGDLEFFRYEEDIPNRSATLYIRLDGIGEPASTLTVDDFKNIAQDTALFTLGESVPIDVVLDPGTFYLTGGGGNPSTEMSYIHGNGYIIGLGATETPGTFALQRGLSDEEQWLFGGDSADLLVYKLENVALGKIETSGQHAAPNENKWDITSGGNTAINWGKIEARVAMSMMNYINVNGREIEISEIARAGEVYTITTTDAGTTAIKKALQYKSSLQCGMNDLYYSPTQQTGSISLSTIYYGKYMPQISVQIPNIEEWGPSLIPYYVIRLVYGTVNI